MNVLPDKRCLVLITGAGKNFCVGTADLPNLVHPDPSSCNLNTTFSFSWSSLIPPTKNNFLE